MAAVSGLVAGCGGAPDSVPTTEVSPGATVTPSRYLILVRQAVAAARAASIRLDAVPGRPTPPELTSAAPGLAAAAGRAEAAARQLSAARLKDTRLENQRQEIGPLYVAPAAKLTRLSLCLRRVTNKYIHTLIFKRLAMMALLAWTK